MVSRVGCYNNMSTLAMKEVKSSVVHTAKDFCVVLSSADPEVYDELRQMDEQFYKTHKIAQWRRSMKKGDIVKSSSPGYYQYKYEAV